ncbi:MAG: hypothetical protein Greene041619_1079 [Candidatus Peregrinibacteria bacterium Greene0416_19]|nr:MAG: hypothetical protein Greene041619_1079 [Candidatus Peregrinibacteria bacterium Greene0416_19]
MQRPKPHIDVIGCLHPPEHQSRTGQLMVDRLLRLDMDRWTHTLHELSGQLNVHCRSRWYRRESIEGGQANADLIVHAAYRLTPKHCIDIPKLLTANRLAAFLLLSYMDLPLQEDWHQHVAVPFQQHKPTQGQYVLPDPRDVRNAERRMLCKSLSAFGPRQISQLLQQILADKQRN